MKRFAKVICILLSLSMTATVLTACPPPTEGERLNNDVDSLSFSVQELDKVFNPYFYTSGYDGEIVGNTQVGMLTADANGEVYCGNDEPTVALDYSQVINLRNSEGELVQYAPENAPTNVPNGTSGDDYFTTYRFLIKNGVKFSDGSDLTIKDILFNMYLYLDPCYTGSSTMYSTPIKGLDEYRTQEAGADSGTSQQLNATFRSKARDRILYLRSYFDKNNYVTFRNGLTEAERNQIYTDVESVRELFWSELVSDYNTATGSIESYQDYVITTIYNFTYTEEERRGFSDAERNAKKAVIEENYKNKYFSEAWEVYLAMEGQIQITWENSGDIKVKKNGTEAAKDENGLIELEIDYGNTKQWKHDKDTLVREVFNGYVGLLDDAGDAINGNKTDIILDAAGNVKGTTLTGDAFKKAVDSTTCTLFSSMASIVTGWATANNALEQFTAEEKSKHFEELAKNNASGNLSFDHITGITVEKVTEFDGKLHGKHSYNAGDEHYVLKIEIDGVDPKAIWNFGFTVGPMAYYSNLKNDTTKKCVGANYKDYRDFNYLGVDGYDPTKPYSLGLTYGSTNYMNYVIKALNGLPMGGGMYQVSNRRKETGIDKITDVEFFDSNIVYFARNEYFYTLNDTSDKVSGSDNPVTNCKIKYIEYKVVAANQLLQAIFNGEVHYGDPSAVPENITKVDNNNKTDKVLVDNNGYGYIGINASYVHNLYIRRAIMYAMDVDLVLNYYTDRLASIIYRPMSKENWAYPEGATAVYPFDEDEVDANIKACLREAGFSEYKNGCLWKYNDDLGQDEYLEYTFTVAGSTEDHPAFATMLRAAEILNRNGFKITVKPDAQALSKLSAGELTVWAAAWSAALDPDMYQVYHKDSTATSIKAWGFPWLQINGSDEEIRLIENLAKKIEEGRSTLNKDQRIGIYHDALDLVMDLAVELPLYQRKNMYVYRTDIVDASTLNQQVSSKNGPLSRMWEVSLNTKTLVSSLR